MNTIDWGKAVKNNNIGWGLAGQNPNGFGCIYQFTYKGETSLG